MERTHLDLHSKSKSIQVPTNASELPFRKRRQVCWSGPTQHPFHTCTRLGSEKPKGQMVLWISYKQRTEFHLKVDIKLWCRLAETQKQGHLRALGSLGPVPNEQVLTWKKLPTPRSCRQELLRGVDVLNPPQESSVQPCTPNHCVLCAVP